MKKHPLWKTIDSLSGQAKDLNIKANALCKQEYQLRDLIKNAKKTILLEERHLARLTWEATIGHADQISLRSYLSDSKDPLFDLVTDRSGCGGSVVLNNGATVHIDDNDIWIGFEFAEKIAYFIRNQNLKVTTAHADKAILDLKEKVNALETLQNTVKSLVKVK